MTPFPDNSIVTAVVVVVDNVGHWLAAHSHIDEDLCFEIERRVKMMCEIIDQKKVCVCE